MQRQLEHAVGGDELEERRAVAGPDRQARDRAEQHALVDEQRGGPDPGRDTARERDDRHPDVVGEDLAREGGLTIGGEAEIGAAARAARSRTGIRTGRRRLPRPGRGPPTPRRAPTGRTAATPRSAARPGARARVASSPWWRTRPRTRRDGRGRRRAGEPGPRAPRGAPPWGRRRSGDGRGRGRPRRLGTARPDGARRRGPTTRPGARLATPARRARATGPCVSPRRRRGSERDPHSCSHCYLRPVATLDDRVTIATPEGIELELVLAGVGFTIRGVAS